MRRLLAPPLFLAALAAVAWPPAATRGQGAPEVNWVWFDEGDPLKDAPAATRYFRRTFAIARGPLIDGELEITADNAFRVWVNGVEAGSGDEWKTVHRLDVTKHLVKGPNVLAVEARNDGGPAGLMVKLSYATTGAPRALLVSDRDWKAAREAPDGWHKPGFDDAAWGRARVLGAVGKVGPWQAAAQGQPGKGRFSVPEGFKVEPVVGADPKSPDRAKVTDGKGKALPFSLVNMTFDGKGRLLVSQERGPVWLCVNAKKDGPGDEVSVYCDVVKNCQGMCWVKDALLLVGDGPQGTGLYRCTGAKPDERLDKATLLHKFRGGMGEHGPHAIVHGPDGFLYLVIGNHAWATVDKLAANSPLTRWPTGAPGPDQDKPRSPEDVLLPRLNDANGHAANILAPGGTIWRLDHEGKNLALFSAGYRNHYDAAFSPSAELFTFDSDMEWDENLPWYRAVRVCHATPGSDFVWRTGAANTPNYYLDSLPPLHETGRGSPVGVEFYDHNAFGPEYRGCYFMADWSIGVIWAVHLERSGATYKAKKAERFCQGAPMNVTDLEVGRDGALYFTMGGRGTQGGVFRIVRDDYVPPPPRREKDSAAGWARHVVQEGHQPLSAWGQAAVEAKVAASGLDRKDVFREVGLLARGDELSPELRVRALTLQQVHGEGILDTLLPELVKDKAPEVRAHAVYLLGVRGGDAAKAKLLGALKDDDAFVRRRACEALVRQGIEPAVDDVWPLLGDKDQFVRTAARLVLQRIDKAKWAQRIAAEKDDRVAWEAIVAVCKVGDGPKVMARLDRELPKDAEALLAYLRTLQLALMHTSYAEDDLPRVSARCLAAFPHADKAVNRELAILLTHAQMHGRLDASPPQPKLLVALKAADGDRQQQIHYFYCMRLLKDGWQPADKQAVLAWYEQTKSWQGGNSFTPFLLNILRDFSTALNAADVAALAAEGDKYPFAAAAVLNVVGVAQLPPADKLAELYARVGKVADPKRAAELKGAVIAALGKKKGPEVQVALRRIADADPGQRDTVARALSASPTAENFPYLVAGLASPNKLVLFDVIEALKRCPVKPKPEDAAPFRAAILAAAKLDEGQRWKAVELLRHWTNDKQFGAAKGDWKGELTSWGRWFGQSFPKEPALPDVGVVAVEPSKYKFDELLAYLTEGEGKKGDPARGKAAFEKANCAKCHKYGSLGEGVGPELTMLSKRFKRFDMLEALYYPSRAISDQYRSTSFVTRKGQTVHGLASAPQDGVITVLQPDGSKVTLKVGEVEQQFASLVSVMPDKLLDMLDKKEIADLFAFLESDPGK